RLLLLGPVEGRSPAHVVPGAGVLDLDDVGPEVGEHERAKAARQQPRQVEDSNIAKRKLAHPASDPAASVAEAAGVACCLGPSPSSSRASATVAERLPTSSAI